MTTEPGGNAASLLIAEWPFPSAAALGSAVRAKGIEQEIRARLSWPSRPFLTVAQGTIRFAVPDGDEERFEAGRDAVEGALQGIEALPMLPREVDDILAIAPRERLKWTKDGRLQSAGTRTVKLRGRKKAITFHVFDPRHIEDLADRDQPAIWREEDRELAAENRRRAGARAAETRAGRGAKKAVRPAAEKGAPASKPRLDGWDAFALDGLLR
jgi:hypothetical protein